MLHLKLEGRELWDSEKEIFLEIPSYELELEHSLIAISKWEARYCRPFLDKKPKTKDELRAYVVDMTINRNVPPEAYLLLTDSDSEAISDYIEAPMTATTINEISPAGKSSVITSEVIYYWMISLTIPFECQKWHINRLLTLIRVCNIKNNPKKGRMNRADIAQRNKELNASRRAAINSAG